ERMVRADTPVLAPYKPEWNTSLVEALNNRPELRMTRQELKVQQLNVMLQENNLRPDLRVGASYNINSIGNRLDGPGPIPSFNAATGQVTDLPGNALGSLADNRFNNWSIFLRFDYPLGYRDAHAALKVAQLNLARSHVVLKNQERKAEFFLGSLYQQLAAYHEQIKLQQAKRIALGTQLQGQFERVKIGKDPLIQLLDAQRSFTGSIQAESDAIVSYNVAIAGFHLAKGTIMDFNGITICDGPLPAAVAERAADHFAARSASLKLRERPGNVAPTLPPAGTPLPLPGVADQPPPPEALEAPKRNTAPALRRGGRAGAHPPAAPGDPPASSAAEAEDRWPREPAGTVAGGVDAESHPGRPDDARGWHRDGDARNAGVEVPTAMTKVFVY